MQFNEKLKELRTKKGVSQSKLADSIYVSRSAVAKWENGLGLPSGESLQLLAEYFEVSVDELCADGSTEKVIVSKNRIISRSRKILITVSAVCAAAVAAIIVLAVVLGRQANEPVNKPSTDKGYTGPWGVDAELFRDFEYDEATGYFNIQYTGANHIAGERDKPIAENEIAWDKFTLSVGQSYVLDVGSVPGGYNGVAFGIRSDHVGLKYDTDIFDIVMVREGGTVEYIFTVKQPCQNEEVLLYRKATDEQITEQSVPSYKVIISAVAPSEE